MFKMKILPEDLFNYFQNVLIICPQQPSNLSGNIRNVYTGLKYK